MINRSRQQLPLVAFIAVLLCLTQSVHATDEVASLEAGKASSEKETLNYYIVDGLASPFQISDKDATQKGYISDIVDELALSLDIELINHVVPSPRIEKLLKDETVTDWIVFDSPAWNSIPEGIPLNTPVLTVTHSAVHCAHQHDFKNQLAGHNFAILKHFRYPGLNKLAEEGQLELTPVKSYQQGFELVDLGRVDGFIEMDTRLRYNLANNPVPVDCQLVSGIGDIVPVYDLILVVSKSISEDRRTQLDQALLKLKQSGFFDQTLKNYTQ